MSTVSANEPKDDPHVNFNHAMYTVNDTMDKYIGRPLVTAYQWLFPDVIEAGVRHFFNNLKEPRTIANDILQGKFQQAANDLDRFAMNTLLGLGGFIHISSYAGVEDHDEDFDQTLAVWGIPQGEYLVLPFLGPSCYRAIPGELVDAISSPVSYISWPIQMLGIMNARANLSSSLAMIRKTAIDPYEFMRSGYFQWRAYKINEGVLLETDDVLDFDNDDEELELLADDLMIKLDK